jgi:beta-mannanase
MDLPDPHYPGHEYVDVLGADIYLAYGHGYDKRIHDHLLALGGGKPIGITENGEMPNIPVLHEEQPSWVFWATWWGHVDADHGNTDALYNTVYGHESVITLDELPF